MTAPANWRHGPLLPFLATVVAVALVTLMDGFMKSASLLVGAYSALLLRAALATGLVGPAWLAQRSAWPGRAALRLHLIRGVVIAFMALSFFSALLHLPLAEGLALSFISPLVALGLAALILKEQVGRRAILAALFGFAGVAVIVGGRIGSEQLSDEAALGIVLVLLSTLLYAWNLILQRQQAQLALPVEIVTFQNAVVALVLLPAAPLFLRWPDATAGGHILAAALLSVGGTMVLSWSYARAEAQVLVPVEYTGFGWAALFGWLFFGETVSAATGAGAALIILGCWIAAPRKRVEATAV